MSVSQGEDKSDGQHNRPSTGFDPLKDESGHDVKLHLDAGLSEKHKNALTRNAAPSETQPLVGAGIGGSDLDLKGSPVVRTESKLDKKAVAIQRLHARSRSFIRLPLQQDWSWDYVMVFNIGSDKEKVKSKKQNWEMTQKARFTQTTGETLKALQNAGLKTYCYKSVQQDEVYCLIGATESRLRKEADRIDYEFELDTKECVEQGYELGMRLAQVAFEEAENDKNKVEVAHWGRIYGKYDGLNEQAPYRQQLYKVYPQESVHHGPNTMFRTVDRLRIIDSIVEGDPLLGGAGLKTAKYILKGTHSLIAYFPLHQPERLQKLKTRWLLNRPLFGQPLEDVRNYFGEKVAIYFGWLEFYCHWLLFPAFLGMILAIWQFSIGSVDLPILPFYGIFVAGWATLFLEQWKRKESEYRLNWGMTHFSMKEKPRPEFAGEHVRNPIDGKLEKYFPFTERLKRGIMSQTIILVSIGAVIASVFGIFLFRNVLIEWNKDFGPYLTAAINAVIIQILNYLYAMLATGLNNWENYRTQSDWENGLIAKSFLFKFVNSYNSLFYIAFIKRYDTAVGGCVNGDCLGELQIQLGMVFATQLVVNNLIEIAFPLLMTYISARSNRAMRDGKEIPKTQPEKEFELGPFESTFEDFDEMAIQFGYVCLFVVAFPLAPLLALVNNYVEIRLDAKKLTDMVRRPRPEAAANIGTWYSILNIIGIISVITNFAIVCFESKTVNDWTQGSFPAKLWTFLVAEHVVLLIKFTISAVVDDEPLWVRQGMERQDYLVEVLVSGVEEEEEELIDDEEEKQTAQVKLTDFFPDAVDKELSDEELKRLNSTIGHHLEKHRSLKVETKESKSDEPASPKSATMSTRPALAGTSLSSSDPPASPGGSQV